MKSTLEKLIAGLPEPVTQHIQHLERMRQDFVANVSHELRTPLTVIHGYLEVLLEQQLDENQKKIFLQMQQQTARMENLVENLLFLSRLESAEEQLSGETIVVATMLENICHEAKALSGDLKHQIQLQADENLKLNGNESELRSLFSNIIFNAIKYTPAAGSIYINWQKEKNHACFSVRDTGIGIDAKHIPRITERFYRVDKARSRSSGGTGLGLAIVKHVLLRHQGELQIASTLNQGSTFTCIFPKHRLVD